LIGGEKDLTYTGLPPWGSCYTPSDAADTIFALSSGPGKAGVAVFRLSGELAGPCLLALCRSTDPRKVLV
jgi:hypothetical protein